MINKFVLWAVGALLVAFILITGYGVLFGSLEWKDYFAAWTGIIGIGMGWVGKLVLAP